MVGTMPVILAVGATFFAHERLSPVGWVALFVSTTGAALIALGGTHHASTNGPTLRGDLYVVLSLCIAPLLGAAQPAPRHARHSAVVVTAYGLCSGTLMLLVVVPLLYGPPIHHCFSSMARAGRQRLLHGHHSPPLELGNDQGSRLNEPASFSASCWASCTNTTRPGRPGSVAP